MSHFHSLRTGRLFCALLLLFYAASFAVAGNSKITYESEAFPMPFAVSFGATVEPLQFFMEGHDAQALVVSIETRHPRDFGEKIKFGAEYTVYDVLTARVGYMKNYDERGFTAGMGVRQTVGGVPLRADYAYQAFGIFGAVHHISLGFGF